MGAVNLLVNSSKKSNKSYSFDPESMECAQCWRDKHQILNGRFTTGQSGEGRIVVFAGDQALPPGWRSNNGTCPVPSNNQGRVRVTARDCGGRGSSHKELEDAAW